MLGEALFLGGIFLTLNPRLPQSAAQYFSHPLPLYRYYKPSPSCPALRRGRKLGSWHMIRKKRLKRGESWGCSWSEGRNWKWWELRMLLLGMNCLLQLPRSCYSEMIHESCSKCCSLPPETLSVTCRFQVTKTTVTLKGHWRFLVVPELAQMLKCEKALWFSFSDYKTWSNFRKIHCILNV